MISRLRKVIDDREAGFTLIELLVVIIIIGILAAIAIPVYLNQRNNGYDAQAKSDANQIAKLEESNMVSASNYTTSTTALGYNKSSNVTSATVTVYDATGAKVSPASGTTVATSTGSYCIDVLSQSANHFFYNSAKGGMITYSGNACPTSNS